MTDWKHDCGYKEPEECGFCEHFQEYTRRERARLEEFIGECWRNAPLSYDPMTYTGSEDYDKARKWGKEHTCHARGSCRHFKKKK